MKREHPIYIGNEFRVPVACVAHIARHGMTAFAAEHQPAEKIVLLGIVSSGPMSIIRHAALGLFKVFFRNDSWHTAFDADDVLVVFEFVMITNPMKALARRTVVCIDSAVFFIDNDVVKTAFAERQSFFGLQAFAFKAPMILRYLYPSL